MTINADEYKSVVGLDQLYVAEVTQDDSSGYVADTPEYFAPATEASAEPTTSLDTQYADNQPFDVMSSEGETKITLTATAIPIAILSKYLGKVFDVASGRMFDTGGGATPIDCALSFRSMKSNGSYRYFQYLKGRFSVPKDEAVTKADKAEPKPSQIIYTAINTIYKFDCNDGGDDKNVKRIVGDEDTTNFDATDWFTQVQTPTTTTPDALALDGPVDPADNASNVAITKTITITFNNALPVGEIDHVVVVKADGTAIACTNSLDVTHKIMTVNPNASLDNSGTYIVAIGVTDIYGDTLNTAVNFATAAP